MPSPAISRRINHLVAKVEAARITDERQGRPWEEGRCVACSEYGPLYGPLVAMPGGGQGRSCARHLPDPTPGVPPTLVDYLELQLRLRDLQQAEGTDGHGNG